MKILLCSPYLDTPDVFQGGISVWARNILEYDQSRQCEVQITPVSFDRKYHVSAQSPFLYRFYYGIKEYMTPINEARKNLLTRQYEALHLCTSAQLSLYKDLFVLRMARHFGAKAVVHFHFGRIPELFRLKNWEYRILMKVCRAADSIVVMDMLSEKTLRRAGFSNVHYLPNPIAPESLQQVEANEAYVERKPGKLVFVGRAIRTKGALELVEACRQFDNIELHVIGLGNPVTCQEMKDIASRNNNGEWMQLRGPLPHNEVLKEMLSASVFVFPSYTEGFPNVILEAMACGCPIVTTTVGSIPEMLDVDGEAGCGICVKPQNVQELVDALRKMISDPDFSAHCAKNARKRVNELYSVHVVWEQLSNIWRTALCQEN